MNAVAPRPYVDPLVEAIDFHSHTNGSDYEVRIGLPSSYRDSDASYPVLVTLDADLSFGTTYEATLLEAMWSKAPIPGATPIPEFIVVGISLPDRMTNVFRRNYEYMPESDPTEYSEATRAYLDRAESMTGQTATFGGAPAFLEVLAGEILPLVDEHYRVDHDRRVLFGQSAGGTFTCYTLFSNPHAFTDYIIVSPGLPDQGIFRLEAAWAKSHPDLPVGVFLAAGERELADSLTIVSNTAQLAERLHARQYPGLRFSTWIVPDASHVQVAAPSIARALSTLWA